MPLCLHQYKIKDFFVLFVKMRSHKLPNSCGGTLMTIIVMYPGLLLRFAFENRVARV